MDRFGDVGGRTGFLDDGQEAVDEGLVFADAAEVGRGAACFGEGGDGGAGLVGGKKGRWLVGLFSFGGGVLFLLLCF